MEREKVADERVEFVSQSGNTAGEKAYEGGRIASLSTYKLKE